MHCHEIERIVIVTIKIFVHVLSIDVIGVRLQQFSTSSASSSSSILADIEEKVS